MEIQLLLVPVQTKTGSIDTTTVVIGTKQTIDVISWERSQEPTVGLQMKHVASAVVVTKTMTVVMVPAMVIPAMVIPAMEVQMVENAFLMRHGMTLVVQLTTVIGIEQQQLHAICLGQSIPTLERQRMEPVVYASNNCLLFARHLHNTATKKE